MQFFSLCGQQMFVFFSSYFSPGFVSVVSMFHFHCRDPEFQCCSDPIRHIRVCLNLLRCNCGGDLRLTPLFLRLACACHTFHYAKRLMETIFVHHFSPGTMPLRAIVRVSAFNSSTALRIVKICACLRKTDTVFFSSSRIVPITGGFRLGWPTILTTLCIHLRVSKTHTHTLAGYSFCIFCNTVARLFVSTAYGDMQAHCALVMFAVCTCNHPGRRTLIIVHHIIIMSCETLYLFPSRCVNWAIFPYTSRSVISKETVKTFLKWKILSLVVGTSVPWT